jgi:hypothetical protein
MPTVPNTLVATGPNTSVSVSATPGGVTAVQILVLPLADNVTGASTVFGKIGGWAEFLFFYLFCTFVFVRISKLFGEFSLRAVP